MYRLRDTLFTYEVCLAADIRRPRMTLDRPDYGLTLDLARALGREDANLRIMTDLVRSATGRTGSGAIVYERFADLVCCGRLVLREVLAPDVYPLTDPYADRPEPIDPFPVNEAEDEPSETWISIELVHAGGLSTANVELSLGTSKGHELDGRTDADGRWRIDGISRGSCAIQLFDHPVLREIHPVPPAKISVETNDIVWHAGSNEPLQLRPGEHHRIVIVQPPRPFCPTE